LLLVIGASVASVGLAVGGVLWAVSVRTALAELRDLAVRQQEDLRLLRAAVERPGGPAEAGDPGGG
jgi:hypothetical protein